MPKEGEAWKAKPDVERKALFSRLLAPELRERERGAPVIVTGKQQNQKPSPPPPKTVSLFFIVCCCKGRERRPAKSESTQKKAKQLTPRVSVCVCGLSTRTSYRVVKRFFFEN